MIEAVQVTNGMPVQRASAVEKSSPEAFEASSRHLKAASMRITEVSRFGQTMLTWYAWYGIAWSILISAVG